MNATVQVEKLVRETEKAILVQVEADSLAGRFAAEVWFPRSQVRAEGGRLEVPGWLAEAKDADLRANPKYARRSVYGICWN